MFKAFGAEFIEIMNEQIAINITLLETGDRFYSVSGGIKDGVRLKTKSFATPKECIAELRERTAYTLLEV